MKILFVDFDGVLNSQGSFLLEKRRRDKNPNIEISIQNTLCKVCTSNFQFILDQDPNKTIKIVISSSWRIFNDLKWLKKKLKSYGIDSSRVIGVTPHSGMYYDRGAEIAAWLYNRADIEKYVIIDDVDDNISNKHGEERFVKTTWISGMHIGHAFEVLNKLGFNPKVKEEG